MGGCVIILNSANDTATDTFQLVDVIIKARGIIAECPGKSKTHLGGLALIGHGKSFFVAVNGPYIDPGDAELGALGGWENATGVGFGTGR